MALIIYPTILLLLHKLAHKRMDFMATKHEKNKLAYLKMGLLYLILLAINLMSIKALLQIDLIRNPKVDLDVTQLLNVLTIIEIIKMVIHLSVNIIKYCITVI
jgi:hypothetical protein